ncbi:alpha/beta hydrolase [Citricoccus zhacaiensis]|uniref:Alpha/beta hydrolase n=1 Tax=Citricoccus zhacaiensis TaxID=489142 RepID=A0ABQ2LVX3_9MICC|nr:alpha/beta fold hydrolase [Citricoccus zhacaiensis]GGO43710.1 alpha/beta hydrolase [Citricoccus zhacaiensis]
MDTTDRDHTRDVASPHATTGWITEAQSRHPERGTITVDGATIAFRRWLGPEEAPSGVLLVHGGGAHSGWWDHVAPLLTDRGPVVALDLSGHGDSDHRTHYSLDGWGDEVLAVLGAAGLGEDPVVVGHSLGGLVTLSLRERPGNGVGRVVVVDSPIEGPEAQRRPEAGTFSSRHRLYPTREAVMERFRPVPPQPTLSEVVEHLVPDSVRQVDGGWTWKFDAGIFDGTARMHITRPGPGRPWAFLRGERGMVPASVREQVERTGGLLVDLPGAGHAPMLDQPGMLIGALRAILANWP